MEERKTCGLCVNDCDLNAMLCDRGKLWLEETGKTVRAQPDGDPKEGGN